MSHKSNLLYRIQAYSEGKFEHVLWYDCFLGSVQSGNISHILYFSHIGATAAV